MLRGKGWAQFSGKLSLIRKARFYDGAGLLEQFVTYGNQRQFAVLAFGKQAVVKRFAGGVGFLSGEAAHE